MLGQGLRDLKTANNNHKTQKERYYEHKGKHTQTHTTHQRQQIN